MNQTTATTTTERTGVVAYKGRPLGLWWTVETGGFAARCGPLGAFYAPSLAQLVGQIDAVEQRWRKNALAKIAERRSRGRPTPTEEDTAKPNRPRHARFFLVSIALAMMFRRWPLALCWAVSQAYGTTALLAAGASGLSPTLAVFLLVGGDASSLWPYLLTQPTPAVRRGPC